ncbi:hypothetical protein H5410_007615 [Solanum commersonii]|uniref:Uncharacterized protein n=1 Tax=Solanum commersonii TaxID=4109 RepID=A0A9J6ACL2_SOLCO|nr:hypothetical protein H5410_007615 [Solanum commersonii]
MLSLWGDFRECKSSVSTRKYTQQLWRIFESQRHLRTMPGKVSEALKSGRKRSTGKRQRQMETYPCFNMKVKLNCILLLCFWCNKLYSNDIVSIIDDLDSI